MPNLYKLGPRQILFAYSRLRAPHDDELSHELALRLLAWAGRYPSLLNFISGLYQAGKNPNPVEVAGVTFPNRVGLAAGMDKNGVALPAWQALGFGFVEVGTVLPRPQAGNARPRVFRNEELGALINRLGFNSLGATVVYNNLAEAYRWGEIKIPIGINVSKMRETPDDAEAVAEDCMKVMHITRPFSSYRTFNASSPNTPGLRSLQEAAVLRRIVEALVAFEKECANETKSEEQPLFVKIDPDGSTTQTLDRLEAIREGGAKGIIIANTTVERPKRYVHPYRSSKTQAFLTEVGGLSGTRLNFEKALSRLRLVRKVDPSFPVVFVSGVRSVQDYRIVRDAGADLVQRLTGLVYEGPRLVLDMRREEEIQEMARQMPNPTNSRLLVDKW